MERKIRNLIVFAIVIVSWAITLIFRMPHIDKIPPVNNVAHIFMLETFNIWKQEGPLKSNFAMKHTFLNKGDKFVTYYKRYQDAEGSNYYVSHPSLSQCIAWLLSGFGKFQLTNASLMWLAIFLQLVTAIILIFFAELLVRDSPLLLLIQVFAGLMYLFHPVILYMNTFHYFAETVGQTMFVITGYLFLKYMKDEFKNQKWSIFLLFIVSFLFVSAEWLGVIFIAAMILLYIIKKQDGADYVMPVIALAGGGFLAVGLFFFQHIMLQDAATFFSAMKIRFIERT